MTPIFLNPYLSYFSHLPPPHKAEKSRNIFIPPAGTTALEAFFSLKKRT
jgi:hypothetical protein